MIEFLSDIFWDLYKSAKDENYAALCAGTNTLGRFINRNRDEIDFNTAHELRLVLVKLPARTSFSAAQSTETKK